MSWHETSRTILGKSPSTQGCLALLNLIANPPLDFAVKRDLYLIPDWDKPQTGSDVGFFFNRCGHYSYFSS